MENNKIKKYLPGLRILKSVISVLICLLLAKFIGYKTPYYACLAAIIVMKKDKQSTKKHGVNRMLGSVFGGVIGALYLVVAHYFNIKIDSYLGIIMIALALLMDFTLAKIMRFDEYAILMSGILLLSVLLAYNESIEVALIYLMYRILETLVGASISLLVDSIPIQRKNP